MFLEEASPCFLDDVYEVLVIICWLPQGVVHPNSASIDLDNKKDPVKPVSCTYMYKKCWIYIHIYTVKSRKKIKNSLEVVRKQNELTSILLMQGPEYVVLGPIRPFPDTLLMYITWVYEADVIVPFSLAFLNLHPTRLKMKEEDEKTHN